MTARDTDWEGVRLHVVTPTRLTDEQRQLIENLSQMLGTPDLPKGNGSNAGFFERIREAFS